MTYFPVMLEVGGRPVAVVGGSAVAGRRIESLASAGAQVFVFASDVGPEVSALVRAGSAVWKNREPSVADLRGKLMVLAERRSTSLDRALSELAARAGTLLSIEDVPKQSGFIMPAVVRHGDLVISISTSGSAPALAVRLRQKIEQMVGREHRGFLRLARRFRRPLAKSVPSFSERRSRWYRLVDSEVLAMIRSGEQDRAQQMAIRIMGVTPDE